MARLDKRTRLLQRAIGYNRAKDGKERSEHVDGQFASVWRSDGLKEPSAKKLPSRRWGFDGRGKTRKGHVVP